jgi:EmrB/QacA subfamily drug resistance transporter
MMADSGPAATRRPALMLVTTVLGSSLAFIDGSVVNVALAALQRDLGAGVSDLQWIVNGYMLTLGALLLLGGAMGDRLGRRRVFMAGVWVFAISSVACALAPSPLLLILARAVQGIGAALLVPNSLAILSSAFPRERRGRAIGTWSGFAAMTSAGGPVLGGWLVDTLSWRAAFWINVPIAAVVLVLAMVAVRESRDNGAHGRMDWPGAVLAVGGLGLISWALIALGEADGHPPVIAGAAALGIGLLALFLRIEARCAAPLLPPTLLRVRAFAAANLLTLLLYGALGAAIFLYPLSLIRLHGYTATEAGAAFLPFPVVLFVLSRWSGALLDRYGPRPPLVIGPAIAALGLGLLAWPVTGTPYWSTFLPGVLVLGVGMGVCIPPLTTVVMIAVDDRYAGVASAVNNAASRVAGLLAVAAVGPLLVAVFAAGLEPALQPLDLSAPVLAALLADPAALTDLRPPTLAGDRATAVVDAARDALVTAFRVSLAASAVLALMSSAVSAWAFRAGPVSPGE